MIKFNNLIEEYPYLIFEEKYQKAIKANQDNVEAISISSFSKELNEVNSRFVNLKFVNKDEFIFFSNYNSPKSHEFKSHNQVAALIYWGAINTQIRMKGLIRKKSHDFNNNYFSNRSTQKNALAISSEQSKKIESYEAIKENYNKVLKTSDLKICPEYWGGFSFVPYYFEFWDGHPSRINKRDVFDKIDGSWKQSYLQP